MILVLTTLLISGCATTTKKEKHVRTASDSRFLQAIYNGNPARIKRLIEAGANVNAKNSDGTTALMEASSRGYTEIMRLLIEAGADVNTQDKNGYTALMMATSNGWHGAVKLLIEEGAKINTKSNYGHTALMVALYKGDLPPAKLLIEAGAVVHLQNNDGDKTLLTALYSVIFNNEEVIRGITTVEFPIKVGEEFITWVHDLTALIFVTSRGHEEVVKLLIENGALITTDEWGRMAVVLVLTKGHTDIIELLKEAGAEE
jgi:ankyrin repeat protein